MRAAHFSRGAGQNFQSAQIYQQFADLPVDNAAPVCWFRLASNLRKRAELYCMFAYLFSHPLYSNTAPFFYGCVLLGLGFFFPFLSWDLFCYFGTRWRGARKRLFCADASVKRGCPL